MDLRRRVSAVLAGAAVLLTAGCGDMSSRPLEVEEAQAQEAMSPTEQELLLEVLNRLDRIESRFEQETKVLRAQLDSLAESGGVVIMADRPSGDEAPPDDPGGGNGNGNSLAGQLDLVESRTDSIMALVDFVAKGTTGRVSLNACLELGLSGKADLKSRTEARGEADGSVGVKPWDTGALAGIKIAQWGMLEFGAGANLAGKGSGCLNLLGGSELPGEARDPSGASGASLASATEAERLESALMALSDRLGITASTLEQAGMTGMDIVESGDFRRLTDLTSTLPTPPAFNDPLGTVRDRITSFDPVDLLCGVGVFGSRIQPRVTEACGFIMDDDLPDLATFASLDLGSLNDLRDACGGREVDACMAVLDGRISRVCDTSSDIRSKLANGIFHSRDDFRLRIVESIFGSEDGNNNVTVTGVSAPGWNCGNLLGD